jgi:hypothetical protein
LREGFKREKTPGKKAAFWCGFKREKTPGKNEYGARL